MSLVERDTELAFLDECVNGTGRAVLVSGAPGLGRTALLAEFTRRAAARGAVHLGAVCAPTEQDVPMAVLDQLVRDCDLPPKSAERMSARIANAMDEEPPEYGAAQFAELKTALWHVLCTQRPGRPIVVGVDDAHLADAQSLRWLMYFVRRMQDTRVVLVFTECTGAWWPEFRSELLRVPHAELLTLKPLSGSAVRCMAVEEIGEDEASRIQAGLRRDAGGNPALVRALLEDHRAGGGNTFQRAVITCVRRGGPAVHAVAQGCAVLPPEASHTLLGEMLDFPSTTVRDAVTVLGAAGLLRSGRFRSDTARAAVLDDMPAELSARMRGRAADLLHKDGAPAAVVADQFAAGADLHRPWVTTVLADAGEQALVDARPARAAGYLKLALDRARAPQEQAVIRALLARAEWQLDPVGVTRHLPALVAAVRDGLLTGRQAMEPVTYLLWHGHSDDAMAVIHEVAHFAAKVNGQDRPPPVWLCCVYLELLAMAPPEEIVPASGHGLAHLVPRSPLVCGDGADEAVVWAQQILQAFRLDGASLAPVAAALGALVHAGRLDRAGGWCTEVLEQAQSRGSRTWQAFLHVVHALVLLRGGDLRAARHGAEQALELLPARSWSAAIGLPLGTAVLVTTEQGRYKEAAELLRTPVPRATFRTPFALLYLWARGRYHLATGDLYAALSDFRSCGQIMGRWGVDLPALIPWRTDLAEAYRRLGRAETAREHARDQWNQLSGGDAHARAVTLRAMAAVEDDPAKRQAILRDAMEEFSALGARLDLAHTLADLSEAHAATGEHAQARAMARRAGRLARECGAEALATSLSAAPGGADAGRPVPAPDSFARLSFAERKVAALAAEGYTNRQIAATLHVTVSTVEQHLTRIYRKLGLSRRSDLPSADPA
ncbi:AAA family ATPase [Actinomadura sp. 3N508]|uniref:AAA family ATPase n=1 Tax=Actinomadura sp. 3N508 TaxID=3375153 RepID=UPI0037AD5F15